MHAHTGLILRTHVGFQKYKKMQVFCINSEVWNESHIVWEPFQTLIFTICITRTDIGSGWVGFIVTQTEKLGLTALNSTQTEKSGLTALNSTQTEKLGL